ncbi:choice-of-anchor A family protein [Streptomyces sp. NRRL S-87]|uniref:choice-of-anchor A family protein n=1 Tax=Streptomyces sp. NRRL S-87 TaxID=1463920 RepID=UPI000D1411B1|nr:choice-of-anchor A family protein [Streptomyces sp. NRRL S-87]
MRDGRRAPVPRWALGLAAGAVLAATTPALAAGTGPDGTAARPAAGAPGRAAAAAPLPGGLGPCIPGRCPDPFPPVSVGTGAKGEDRNINIFVGGNFRVRGRAAEAEGKVVVLGDFDQDKDPAGSSVYNVGIVGAGSLVRPPLGSDFLTTGGDVTVAAGERLLADGGVVRHAGALTGVATGTPVRDTGAALPYAGLAPRLTAASRCYARVDGSPRPSTGTASNTGSATVFTGDGTSALQVFNVDFDMAGATGGQQGLEFRGIPAGATVLVNVLGTTRTINTYVGDSPYRDRLLWNFPDATTVNLTGTGQFQGSVLIGQGASQATVSLPGMNGRFFTAGGLTHTSATSGVEFHAYPFNGDLPACGDEPEPTLGDVSVLKEDAGTQAPLAGARFELWRETNATAGLQTGGATPDTLVGEACTTPTDGICVRRVPLGTYYWRETAPPDGYALPDPAVFAVPALTEENAGAGVSVTAANTRTPDPGPTTGRVRIVKVDAESRAPLGGAAFTLWRETNGTPGLQSDGAAPDTSVTTCATSSGDGSCTSVQPLGTYYWQETAAPTGYDLPDPRVFGPLVLTAGNAADGVAITASNTRHVPPEPPYEGRILLLKTDAKTGRPLAGAVFELWRETNGTPGLQNRGTGRDLLVDDGCATDDQGACTYDTLVAGSYYLVETDVPEGYAFPDVDVAGPFEVSQRNPDRTVTVRLANKRGYDGGKGDRPSVA